MEISEKLNLVESFLGEYRQSGNEYLFYCPFCDHHKKKLSLNFEKGKYKCWVCDSYGLIRKLVKQRSTQEIFSKWKQLDGEIDLTIDFVDIFSEPAKKDLEKIISLPENFHSLSSKNPLNLKFIKYLKAREIAMEDILYWKLGYCSSGEFIDRIIFPSFNNSGNLNFFAGRTIKKLSPTKYKNAEASKDIIFNELYLDFDSDLVVTEGIFDAMKAGHNSVPLLGSTMREDSKLFQKIVKYDTTVYIALDPDAREKENRIIKELLKYGVTVYKVDVEPFEDVGKMSKEEFQDRKKAAELMNNTKLLELQLEKI